MSGAEWVPTGQFDLGRRLQSRETHQHVLAVQQACVDVIHTASTRSEGLFGLLCRLTIERHFSWPPELSSQSGNQDGQSRISSRNSAEEPCHGWRTSVSARWDGRSRVIFACPLVVGESHAGNVKEEQHLLAGETGRLAACARSSAPLGSHHIQVAKANRVVWPEGVVGRRGQKAWPKERPDDMDRRSYREKHAK